MWLIADESPEISALHTHLTGIRWLREISLTDEPLPDGDVTTYHPAQISSLIFTSGSTGVPKVVAHTSSNHFASARGLLSLLPFGEQDCWLLSLPLYHVSGLSIIYRWLLGGTS